jgi:hypothetical protein
VTSAAYLLGTNETALRLARDEILKRLDDLAGRPMADARDTSIMDVSYIFKV